MKKEPKYPLFKILIPTKKQEITDLLGAEDNVWLYERTIEDLKAIAIGEDMDEEGIEEYGLDTKAGQYDWVFNTLDMWIHDRYTFGLAQMVEARKMADADIKMSPKKKD